MGPFPLALTCYEADGGTVTTAQFWISPCHHGYPKVVVPGWQQICYSLDKDGEKQETTKRKPVFMEVISVPWVTININKQFFVFFFYVFRFIFEVQ